MKWGDFLSYTGVVVALLTAIMAIIYTIISSWLLKVAELKKNWDSNYSGADDTEKEMLRTRRDSVRSQKPTTLPWVPFFTAIMLLFPMYLAYKYSKSTLNMTELSIVVLTPVIIILIVWAIISYSTIHNASDTIDKMR